MFCEEELERSYQNLPIINRESLQKINMNGKPFSKFGLMKLVSSDLCLRRRKNRNDNG